MCFFFQGKRTDNLKDPHLTALEIRYLTKQY